MVEINTLNVSFSGEGWLLLALAAAWIGSQWFLNKKRDERGSKSKRLPPSLHN